MVGGGGAKNRFRADRDFFLEPFLNACYDHLNMCAEIFIQTIKIVMIINKFRDG